MRRIYAIALSAVTAAAAVLLALVIKPVGGPTGDVLGTTMLSDGSSALHFDRHPRKIEVVIPVEDAEAEFEWFILKAENINAGSCEWRKVPFSSGESRTLTLSQFNEKIYFPDAAGEYYPIECYRGEIDTRELAYRLAPGLYRVYIRKKDAAHGSLDSTWFSIKNFTVGSSDDIALPDSNYGEFDRYIALRTAQEVYPEDTRTITVFAEAVEGDAVIGHGTVLEKYIDGEWRVASLGDGGIDSRRETISIKKGEEGRFAYVFNGTLPLDAGRYRIVAAFRHEINGVRRGRDKYAAAEFTVSGKSEPKRAESVSAKLTAFSEEVFADVEITNNNDSAVWVMNGSESSGISYELIRIDDDLGLEYIVRHRVRFLAEVAPGETFTVKARYMLPEYLISRIDDAYLYVYDCDGTEMRVDIELVRK